jgi:hypothetical protein
MTDKELYQQMLHFIECSGYRAESIKKELKIRLAQPEKEWQGLTDEERNACLVEADPCEALLEHEAWQLMRDIEAKLKEKNT